MTVVWAVAVIAYVITGWTVFRGDVYTLGSNLEGARFAAIAAGRVTLGVPVLPAFAGAAGILFASRIANGVPTAGKAMSSRRSRRR